MEPTKILDVPAPHPAFCCSMGAPTQQHKTGWLENSPGREAPRLRAAMRIMGWRPSRLLEELGAPHVTTEGIELFPSPTQVLTMAQRG